MTQAWRDRLTIAAPLAVIGLIAANRPGDGGVTVCPFALLTGMACPGCGMTRAASYLVRGDVSTALTYHPLVPLVAILFVGGCAWYMLWRSGRVEPLPTRWVNTILIVTGVILLGVWVARLLSGTLPPV